MIVRIIYEYISFFRRLYFGNKFNKPVENLPCEINKIIFGKKFNQPLDFLPNSLQFLDLSKCNYNYNLDNFDKSSMG